MSDYRRRQVCGCVDECDSTVHFGFTRLVNIFVCIGDLDLGVLPDERVEQRDERRHRLVHHPTIDPRVQHGLGTSDPDIDVHDAAEPIREAGVRRVEPVVVRLDENMFSPLTKEKHNTGKRTMQTQSTMSNQPWSPLAASLAMKSSRPSLELSSMASKQKRMLTGSSRPWLKWASRTFSHPSTGPLSSVEPRPYILPVSLSRVKVNGSYVHPSSFFACD